MRKLLIEEQAKRAALPGQQPIFDNIYNNTSKTNNTNNINNNITNTDKPIKQSFPNEDYNLVLDAFRKYKGVGLVGPEVLYHKRAIKLMFEAKHTPKEIIDFMKWLKENEKNEEQPWVKMWTIWTVQKKIPEFLGGKLKISKTIEEEFPAYGK
jgi:cellobiose-specific phosphotransferase system component IIB